MKGIVVAGTGSNVGKTVVTLAVIEALRSEGLEVQPFKVGPDYIDPSHHEAAAGRKSRNLDLFMMGKRGVKENYARGEGDIAVVEGVMGMFDGGESSTAAVAELLDLPVVLVVDGKSRGESVAAVAHGFATFGDVEMAGVIVNRAGSPRHVDMLRSALQGYGFVSVLPRLEGAEVPDRHLGLHMSSESGVPRKVLRELAGHLDGEALDAAAREASINASPPEAEPQFDARIGVALDAAFNFYYPSNLELLRRLGEVETFSPLRGETPDVDAVYLGGGYPELHAAKLSGSGALDWLRDRALDGMPVYGECGGMMALGESLETDTVHSMAGVLPLEFRMVDRLQAVGYVEAECSGDGFAPRGRVRGHEFHYSECTAARDARAVYSVTRGKGVEGRDGFREHSALGAYTHVHAASAGDLFEGLVRAAERYRKS